jgi:hypothetical protein
MCKGTQTVKAYKGYKIRAATYSPAIFRAPKIPLMIVSTQPVVTALVKCSKRKLCIY